MLSGILCVDKPPDHTSFDVVARMRGISGTKKIGHGGTLDPMATGVLPLFFGRAAKFCDLLPDRQKRYIAGFRLGVVTDTQDITGTVLERRPVTAGRREVLEALRRFVGPQLQTPPMYSAVRVGGQRLYDLARRGVEVERPPRPVTVYAAGLLGCDEAAGEYTVEIACSSGTYVRTLCHDLGASLGCGAAMTALRRISSCGFALEACLTMEDAERLAGEGALVSAVLPVESAFAELPRLELNEKLAGHFLNGVALSVGQFKRPPEGRCAVFRENGAFLGLAEPAGGRLWAVKLFFPDGNQTRV